jgi:hypothetical protein
MEAYEPKDWKELSQAAAEEQDPHKLMELVEQLNRVLEERESELKQRRSLHFVDPKRAPVYSGYLSL